MGKKEHIRKDCWHWNKKQTEGKNDKNDNEKNTTAAMIDENVLMLSIEEQKCELLLIMMLRGLLILQLPTILSLEKGCLPRTKQGTLVL